jgi:hypothetical protein
MYRKCGGVSNYGFHASVIAGSNRWEGAEMSNLKALLGMRQSNPEGLAWMLAHRHVERGTEWLLRHAPFGWRRNLFAPLSNGRSTFRCHTDYDNECVLAIAFESNQALADPNLGYVMHYRVTNHFGMSWRRNLLLGFSSGYEVRGVAISGNMLDLLWVQALTSPIWSNLPVRWVTEEERRQLAELRRIKSRREPFWKRFFRWLGVHPQTAEV